jgi:hypothetical protein
MLHFLKPDHYYWWFSEIKIWLGARGSRFRSKKRSTAFTGKIDEFRLWNTLRNVEQISEIALMK